jgi:hypothetical protein
MSQSDFSGSVVPGQEVVAKALMGTVDVDLRRDDLPDVVHVRATAVMGEVKVHVPPGTTVHLSGLAVMGERKDRTGTPSASGAVVHVHASAVMGTVNVDDASRPGGPLPAQRGGSVPERHRSPRRRVVRSLIAAALVVGAGYGVEQVATAGDGSALFGSSVVTVRGQHDVHVGTAFGSVKVVVPDGAHVRTTGRVLFGSIDCPTACATPGTGASDVVVHAGGGFGSVEVETATEAQADH